MQIGDRSRDVGQGDAIAILPGEVHSIVCTSPGPLVFLCCCTPPYEHSDTVLVEQKVEKPL